jgi:hypothetical protein
MSPLLIAIFFGAGVGGWAWAQLAHRTGNNDQRSVAISALAVGVLAAVIIFTLFKFVLNW